MKRIFLIVVALVGLIAAALLFIRWSLAPSTPVFRPISQPFAVPPYQNLSYTFLSPRPFAGDRMWVLTWSGTNNYHYYLYDLDHKAVLGELANAEPEFLTSDQSKLFCVRYTYASRSRAPGILKRLNALLRSLARGQPRYIESDSETVWIVDLHQGSVRKLGTLTFGPSSNSSFVPSPSFRYAYKHNFQGFGLQAYDLFVCDLERQALLKHSVAGYPAGWWSDSEILCKGTQNDFFLYDVATRKKIPLLSAATVAEAFQKVGLADAPARANFFPVWNGQENEFYLTDLHPRWLATNSYLFKIERSNRSLQLLAADFKFEWSDHFSATGTAYIYSGRQSGVGSSGVFLRDLKSKTNCALVPSDGAKYFSLPHFYHDKVVYCRSNQLWQVDLAGSNHVRVFPPPDNLTAAP